MNISLLNLKRQYEGLREEIEERVSEILLSSSYINGPYVKEFEKNIAAYLGVKHAIGVGNGTDALVIILKALGVGEGDEVITTPFTFFATAEAISCVGAIPVFVDVNLDDFNIDVNKIEEEISEKTKAIMPVHIFGSPANMDRINEIAKKHKIKVIEDACQAIGAQYKGKMVGGLGDISAFSFFPTKNLGTYGDGGLIATNSDELATICRALKAHGSGTTGENAYNLINGIKKRVKEEEENTVYTAKKYYNYLIAHNSRLDEIHAGILDIKLKSLDKWNNKRISTAKLYGESFKGTSYKLMNLNNENKNVYHMYILQSEEREKIIFELEKLGIATGTYYPVPLHLQKVYSNLGYKNGDLPNAEYLSKRTFAIPIDPELTDNEIEYIVKSLKNED